jgi:hypothetical protein
VNEIKEVLSSMGLRLGMDIHKAKKLEQEMIG